MHCVPSGSVQKYVLPMPVTQTHNVTHHRPDSCSPCEAQPGVVPCSKALGSALETSGVVPEGTWPGACLAAHSCACPAQQEQEEVYLQPGT